jgi:hypothetical protein
VITWDADPKERFDPGAVCGPITFHRSSAGHIFRMRQAADVPNQADSRADTAVTVTLRRSVRFSASGRRLGSKASPGAVVARARREADGERIPESPGGLHSMPQDRQLAGVKLDDGQDVPHIQSQPTPASAMPS